MTPKDKAKELICKMQYNFTPLSIVNAKQCALIAVDLVLDNLEDHTGEDIKYWQEVKQEIEKL